MSASLPAERGAPEPIRVLMVDDSAAFCRVVAATLAKEPGLEVRDCQEPSLALGVAIEWKPTVILQDMVMPGVDGIEMVRTYRRHPATEHVPVLMLTSEDAADLRNVAFQVGADDYLRKGVPSVELVARIRYHGGRYLAMRREGLDRHVVASGANRHTVKVLAVEPSKLSQSVLSAGFRRDRDFEVHFAVDERSCLRIADDVLPTVIVVSLFGGDYDAFELIRRLRARRATFDVPIVLLTSTDDPEMKRRALEPGYADDYAIKSSDMSDFVARLRGHSTRFVTLRQARLAALARGDDGERVRVLMIDDSVAYCRSIEALLRSERAVDFRAIHDPTTARAAIRESPPSVVLLDLDMPERSGLDLLRELRDDPTTRELPVVVLSGEAESMIKARAFALGADDYVDKQVDKIELVSRLHHHARAHKAATDLRRALEAAMHMHRRVEVQSDFIRRTFGRYLSDGIVDAILDDPSGLRLGGESRVVTLMMTDLRGFTAMSERLAPDEVIEILNQYFEVMTRVLMRYEATIDEFIGDAIFAIFGAPTTMPDHAERAVACAIAMQNAMAEVNDALTKRGRPELEMGIGLNTGDVVVGNVGSERRTKYGVVGRNVNLASRVESYTVGGQILAADSTIVGTRGLAKTRGSRIVEPKGIQGKILLHEVHAIDGAHAIALTPRATAHELAVPNAPLSLHASPIEGKDKLAERSLGRFLKLGSHGAVVAIERAFPVDANLQLTLVSDGGERLADDVVAKVVGLGPIEGTVELRFTSVSPEARQTIASLVPPGR